MENDGVRFARRLQRQLRRTGSRIKYIESNRGGKLIACNFNYQKLQKKFPSPNSLRLVMERAADKVFAIPEEINFTIETSSERVFQDGEWRIWSTQTGVLVDMYAEVWPFHFASHDDTRLAPPHPC
jgi:hypothetical protein